jgi:two-component system, response regulator PdtaR
MTRSVRIVVADDEQDAREYLREILTRLGHEVVLAQGGRQLVELCRSFNPDLIVVDVKMPDMDGLEAAAVVNQGDQKIPVILISAHAKSAWVRQVPMEPIMAYLIKPVRPADVENAVIIAMLRFGEFAAARKEAGDLRRALEDRKIIERAKGAIMRRLCVDEHDGFQRMKRFASNHNHKLVDVAKEILAAENIFHEIEAL